MGIGIISVTTDAFAQVLGAPIEEQYRLGNTPLDTIQAAFLLPAEYAVVGVVFDFPRRVYLVGVESASLPEVPEGQLAPEVTPTYVREADGTVRLLKIDVSILPDYRPWHPVPLPKA